MSGMGTPHEKLFKTLLDDPGRAVALVGEYLSANIAALHARPSEGESLTQTVGEQLRGSSRARPESRHGEGNT